MSRAEPRVVTIEIYSGSEKEQFESMLTDSELFQRESQQQKFAQHIGSFLRKHQGPKIPGFEGYNHTYAKDPFGPDEFK